MRLSKKDVGDLAHVLLCVGDGVAPSNNPRDMARYRKLYQKLIGTVAQETHPGVMQIMEGNWVLDTDN